MAEAHPSSSKNTSTPITEKELELILAADKEAKARKEKRDELHKKESLRVSPMLRLKRFLCYGSEIGLFQPCVKNLKVDDCPVFSLLLNRSRQSDEAREFARATFVKMIEDALERNDKCTYPETAIFCLAMLACHEETSLEFRTLAYEIAEKYLITFHQLTLFIQYKKRIEGVPGNCHRKERDLIANWYNRQESNDLLKLIIIHNRMNGISHQILIKKSCYLLKPFKKHFRGPKYNVFTDREISHRCIYLIAGCGTIKATQIIEEIKDKTVKELYKKRWALILKEYNSLVQIKEGSDPVKLKKTFKLSLNETIELYKKPITPSIWESLIKKSSVKDILDYLPSLAKKGLISNQRKKILADISSKLNNIDKPIITAAEVLISKKKYVGAIKEMQTSAKTVHKRKIRPYENIVLDLILGCDLTIDKSLIPVRHNIESNIIIAIDLKTGYENEPKSCAWNKYVHPFEAMTLIIMSLKNCYKNVSVVTFKNANDKYLEELDPPINKYTETNVYLNTYAAKNKLLTQTTNIPAIFDWAIPLTKQNNAPCIFIVLSALVNKWKVKNLTTSFANFQKNYDQKQSRLIMYSLCDMSIRFTSRHCSTIIDMVGFSKQNIQVIEDVIAGRL